MIWKIVVVLSVALHVQGEDDAISEQRVVIHHQKSFRKSLSHIGSDKSGNQDAYARAYPSYEFSYNVNDPKTRDIKGQHETREGDEVIGNYWLIEPNGQKRTVNYQANDDNGFNAQIDYTAALKGEKRDEDISVSNAKDKEQGDSEKNNEEGIEIKVREEIQENQDSDNTSIDTGSQPTAEENSSSDETDNQEDEANNISNVERVNVNREYDGNLARSSLDNDNLENNNQKIYDRKSNVNNKGKQEKLKKNKNQDRPSWNNDNNNNKATNNKRIKQDDSKRNENERNHSEKRKNTNRNKNSNVLQNRKNDYNVNKGKSDKNHDENERKQNVFRKEEINDHNEHKDVLNNQSYAEIGAELPIDEIQRQIDIPKNEETYEHRIRIHHPKNISPTTRKEEQRKH